MTVFTWKYAREAGIVGVYVHTTEGGWRAVLTKMPGSSRFEATTDDHPSHAIEEAFRKATGQVCPECGQEIEEDSA